MDGEAAVVHPYQGLAAWVDVFDPGPWNRPERTMGAFARRGVRTVFVQTSNHTRPRAIHRPRSLARLLGAARRHRIDVVGWYLPGFDDPARDWRRVRAALGYESPAGDRFDGFALDIEAIVVRDVAVRNRRMLRLSSRLRRLTAGRRPVGAIVPDPVTQRYWPRFPWRAVRYHYDVLLPMAYWTFRVSGARDVHRYSRAAVRAVRARTGDSAVPVHPIGGIASDATPAEVGAFARAAAGAGAVGASLYDAPITTAEQWRRMKASSWPVHTRLTGAGENDGHD
jgi:hypothetical protein